MSVEFENNFVLVKGKLTAGMEKSVEQAAIFLEGKIKETLGSGNRSGKMYKVPGANRRYQASAPGEAPAVMLSNYMNSITHVVQKKPGEIVGIVGTNQKQGRRLEFGFVGVDARGRRYNQAPRPHMRKTYEKNKQEIIKRLSRRIE